MGENMAGDMAGDFETVRSKRRKRNESTEEMEKLNRDLFLNSSKDNKLNMIFSELQHIRISQETTNRGMRSFQNSFVVMNEKLDQVVDVINSNTSVLKTLAYKSIDLEARSRRNNLIFWGFSEIPNENCFAIIRDFIADRLDLDPSRMYLTRAHRLGPRRTGSRNHSRPIIVNFRDFCDTEAIMERAHMLKNTSCSIGYDLPKEINDARKKLWDELKSIKSRQPRAKVQIIYPAKLVVDGKVVKDEFPDWNEAMRCSRLSDFSHIDKNPSYDQPTMIFPDSRGEDRNIVNEPLWPDNVASDFTTRSTTRSNTPVTQPNVNEQDESRNLDMEHNERSKLQSFPRSVSIEMVELNSDNKMNEETQQNKIANKPMSPRSQARSRSMSSEKDGIFRPYDKDLGTHGSASNESTIQQTQNNLPPDSNRVSRTMERGLRRPPSASVTRIKQTTSNKTENTGSKNKHSCAQNNSQSKQNQTGHSTTSYTPTQAATNNSSTGASDQNTVSST